MRIAFRHLLNTIPPEGQPDQDDRAEQLPAEAPPQEPIENAAETPNQSEQE